MLTWQLAAKSLKQRLKSGRYQHDYDADSVGMLQGGGGELIFAGEGRNHQGDQPLGEGPYAELSRERVEARPRQLGDRSLGCSVGVWLFR